MTAIRRQAFLRLFSPADLHDAVLLLLSGVDVAIEPVPGALSGLGKPRGLYRAPHRRPQDVVVKRTPVSIAAGVLRLITDKAVPIGPGNNDIRVRISDDEVAAAFEGLSKTLSQRAGRPLDRIDVLDVLGWIMPLTTARLDVQVPYGCPEWGAFLRGEADATHLGRVAPPACDNITRTVVCHTQPTRDDLVRMLSHAPIGIVNAMALSKRAPWACAMSADQRLYLASHTVAPIVTWDPGECGPMPVMTRELLLRAGTPDAAMTALYGHVWDEARRLSRIAFEASREPLPDELQTVWTHQRDALHLHAVDVVRMPPCAPDDLRRHALDGAYRLAAELRLQRPPAVTSTKVTTCANPIDTLRAQAHWTSTLCTNHAAADVVFAENERAQVADYLGHRWDEFVAARFRRSPSRPC